MGRPFHDRTDAGLALAEELVRGRHSAIAHTPVVLGIARGGVVVAAPVAAALHAPLGAVIVRKLGAPSHPEYALGAIADGVRVVDAEAVRSTRTDPAQLDAVEAEERGELARRQERYALGSQDVAARAVIVVDDGIATGSSATAACRALRTAGAAHITLAVPVAPSAWHPAPDLVDDYVCLHAPHEFWAVGQFYERFDQTTDAQVETLLAGG